MKEITLQIPDSKFQFFMELVKQLGIDADIKGVHIPEEHKNEVRRRIEESKKHPEKLLNWDDVKNNFKLD
jgi:hypothetical protein